MADTTTKKADSSRRDFIKIGAGVVAGAVVVGGAEYVYFNGIVSNKNSTVSGLQSQLSSAQANVSTLEGQLSSATANLNAAQANVQTLTGQLSTAQGNVQTLTGQLNT